MIQPYALIKALTANANTSAFTAKTAIRSAEPTTNVVRLSGLAGGVVPDAARFFPYGLGADNDAFSMRVFTWSRLQSAGVTYWVPAQLFEVSCTISGFVGLAGGPVLNTERFADTMSLVATVGEATTTANTTRDGTVRLYSPANDMPAWVYADLYGAEFLEFDFDQTTNTPTMNCLVELIGTVPG